MGNQLDLENLMNTYGPTVLKYAYFCLKNHALAEDVFQEVFLKAFQSLHTIRDPEKLKA